MSSNMTVLVSNSVEMTPEQLLEVTERMTREYHSLGHRSSPQPTEEDVWVMFEALNFTVWLCPWTGHRAIKLLHEKEMV